MLVSWMKADWVSIAIRGSLIGIIIFLQMAVAILGAQDGGNFLRISGTFSLLSLMMFSLVTLVVGKYSYAMATAGFAVWTTVSYLTGEGLSTVPLGLAVKYVGIHLGMVLLAEHCIQEHQYQLARQRRLAKLG